MPVIRIDFFGKKGSITAAYTEGKDGWIKVVSKRFELKPLNYIHFPAETESIGVFQQLESETRMALRLEKCIKEDLDPLPNVYDGAKVIAVGDAAWEFIKNNGKVVKVKSDF